MNTEDQTRHGMTRMAQRAFDSDDLDLIMLLGVEVHDGYFVRTKDCQAAERRLKRLIERVRGLDGTRVVLAGGRLVTAYYARESTRRRLLRRAERRSLS